MFTGLVEEIGTVKRVIPRGNEISLGIDCSKILEDVAIGDSVNIDGACQTVVKIENKTVWVDTVAETLKKTTFGNFRPGTRVNLERALSASARLGGHFVSGHIDTTGRVTGIKQLQGSHILAVSYDSSFNKNVIPVGSICINGVSLTVAEKLNGGLKVAVIPHTWEMTNLSLLKVNDEVNLEFDLLGKYILNFTENQKEGGLTLEKLKESGFA